MMRILQIKPLQKRRHCISFEMNGQELTMPLYGGELHRFHITEDAELPDSVYEEIKAQVLNKRAMERSQYLLAVKNYTAAELTDKLRQGFYPEEVIEHTLRFLQEYGFIDDERYAERFVESQLRKKSIRQVRMELAGKGIAPELAERVLAEYGEQESDTLSALAEKRCRNTDLTDEKEWNRQLRYFAGKGFPFDEVKRCLTDLRQKQ